MATLPGRSGNAYEWTISWPNGADIAPNLFYGTGLAACILVFRQRKAKDGNNKVLILDASKEFKTGRTQNKLLPAHVERIHG